MEKYTGLEIAVIGLSGRFPMADNIMEFWSNIRSGRDCISDFTEQELLDAGIPEELVQDPLYVRSNGYTDRKQFFDSGFFNYRPDEAAVMDPQMRVFHECCWEALEDSGYANPYASDKIGLFASGTPAFNWMLYSSYNNRNGLVDDFTATSLQDISFLCSRISYKLNLSGPSVFSQTACSSSLVAIHQACNSLLLGECTMALAGGVTINNFSHRGYLYKKGLIYSRDGRCRAFDSNASGTIQGEGAGVVVLKRLSEAIRDADNIYAVIKGSAINNDGSEKVGYTAPSVSGQADVIRRALKMAAIKTDSIGYIEAHGTGTELGDPVEIEALNNVFGSGNYKRNSCAIASLKSNIGHLDSAAGVAGFIKVALALKHRQIPSSLHFNSPNPRIDFAGGPFYVNTELKEWVAASAPLRAGVSSFGIGGTNAHAILEEAPEINSSDNSRDYQLLVLSAKTNDSLQRMKQGLVHALEKDPQTRLSDIAYTLQKGRARFNHRMMLVCNSRETAIKELRSGITHTHTCSDNQESVQNVVFMFSGQGSQYINMCADLYKHERLFREKVDECMEIARQYAGVDYRPVLFPGSDSVLAEKLLLDTSYTQPVLFIVEYALARLMMSWGIHPHYMIGHSIGEYTAACISGVFSVADAIRLVIKRGQLMSSLPTGAMLSIRISKEQLEPLLEGVTDIDLAVVNSPQSLVVAGKEQSIELFEEKITSLGYPARRVHTSHAFHSRMMDVILDQFEQEVATVSISAPSIPYISNVTGTTVDYATIRQPAYWSQHLRSCVEFSKGTDYVLSKGKAVLIEIGPGKTLCNYVTESSSISGNHLAVNIVRQARQNSNDLKYLIEKLGLLWLNGININWDAFYKDEKRKRVSLPTYPFEKTFYRTNVDAVSLITAELINKTNPYTYKTEDSIHSMEWQRSPLPHLSQELSGSMSDFLIFGNSLGLTPLLKEKFQEKGQRVISVYTGEPGRFNEAYDFSVNLSSYADIEKLFENLNGKGIKCRYIIYASALTTHFAPDSANGIHEAGLRAGYLGLNYLCKAIAAGKGNEKVDVLVVNNYLADVMPGDVIDPLKSTVLGPSKLIAVENAHIRCKTIDIPFPFADKGERSALLQNIIDELFYDYDENFVAYRYRQRWVPAYNQLSQHPQLGSGITIRNGATYVVVGGMGGMGLSIVSDLVQRYQAEIILVHRSPFPERSEWSEWIMQKGENDDTVKRILKLQELERQGGKVKLYQVNVAVEEEVQRFINTITANEKKMAGLVWAAGEVDYGGIILNRNEAGFISYISSKVHGLIFFEKYLNFRELEFLALFSSMGNVFYQVKFGQVAYNAANEYLNNYALYARKQFDIHAFAINWCDWMEVGMTVRSLMEQKNISDVRQVNKEIYLGLTPKEGVSLFHTCLGTRLPAYYIYKGNIREQVKQYKVQLDQRRLAVDAIKETKETNDVPKNTQSALIKLYADFFGKPSITLQDDFFELGGDSLKAMILTGRINQQTGSNLTISDIYRYPTVARMADKLELTTDQAQTATENSLEYQCVIGNKVYYELAESQSYWLNDASENAYKTHEKHHGLLVVNYKIKGDIDPVCLGQAIEFALQRHECLHSTFHWINEKAWLRVENEYRLNDIYNYRDTTDEKASFATDQELEDYVYFVNDVMDISRTLPLRMRLTKVGMASYVLSLKIHHVTSDAWSNNILFRDLLAAYRAFVQKQQPLLPELKWQYKDIMRLELEYVQKHGSADKDYWANRFPNYYKPVLLPIPRKKQQLNEFKVRRNESFSMPAKITSALKSISNKQGVSFFVTLQASFKYFLFYTTRQSEQGVGTFIYGRSLEADNLLGNYARLAFVRTQFEENDSFLKALEKVNRSNEDMRAHRAYPLHLYMSEKMPAGKSIFDDFLQCAVQFSTDTNFYMDNSVAGWEISQMPNHGEVHMQPEMELTFYLQEAENKLQLLVMYNDTAYQLEKIEDFIAGYILFLEEITDQPATGMLSFRRHDPASVQVPAHNVNN